MSLSLPSTYVKIKWHVVNHVALIFSLRYVHNAVIKKPGILKYKSQVRNWLNKDYTHFIIMMISVIYQLGNTQAKLRIFKHCASVNNYSFDHWSALYYILRQILFQSATRIEEWHESVWDRNTQHTCICIRFAGCDANVHVQMLVVNLVIKWHNFKWFLPLL